MSTPIQDAQAIFHVAVRSVQADCLFASFDITQHLPRPIATYGRVIVVGAGKAAMAMAGQVEARWGEYIDAGLVVVPHGYRTTIPKEQAMPQRIEVVEAGHPVPDEAGAQAAWRVLNLAAACTAEDVLLVLISGGGSALWPAFAPGISLEAAQATFRLLLRSGADIHAINTVRKHLSHIGGGRLAEAAHPATVLALILSDVPGDDVSVIASGPAVADRTTLEEARQVLRRFKLWQAVPAEIRTHLERDDVETPKSGNPVFESTKTVLLGSNRTALEAARREATARGYDVRLVTHPITGAARVVGQQLAQTALGMQSERPVCLLQGGETTVVVRGRGRGGRNQELALAAAIALDGAHRDVVILSGGTDGIDGSTDAAGAWATPQTVTTARRLGLDPHRYLDNNDSYAFFEATGGLLRTGATHTNVMDVQIALIGGQAA